MSTYFVNDTFTDVNSTLIADHIGEVGATWTREYLLGDVNWRIQGNALQEADYAGAYYDHYIHASGTPPAFDYFVEIGLIYASVVAIFEVAIVARGYTVPDDGFGSPVEDGVEAYLLVLGDAGGVGSSAELAGRWSGGGGSAITGLSVADGSHTVRLEVAGTTATLLYDGVQVNQQTVTGITGVTPSGFTLPGYVAVAMQSAANNDFGVVKVDYFKAGSGVPPPAFWTDYVKCTEVTE